MLIIADEVFWYCCKLCCVAVAD